MHSQACLTPMTSGFGQQALHFVINEANIASGEETPKTWRGWEIAIHNSYV
jgi:hypothetical protein